MPESKTIGEPRMREVEMHLRRPNDPATGRVTKSVLCTASRKAAGIVRHIEFDVSGTELEGKCYPGQSVGVLAPGEDGNGRPHKVRLYSLASPTGGEDGEGKVYSTTVKRTIDEHWQTHELFLGVASNYLCDLQEGAELRLSGPNGKRFVLPAEPSEHDYVFMATGTGIAPFRGMCRDLLEGGTGSSVTLIMGAPYSTDLLYHDEFLRLAERHEKFTYLTAISRERQEDGHDRMYVQDRLRTERDALLTTLTSERTLVYVCGIAGMELGIFQQMARLLSGEALEQYLRVDPEALHDIGAWTRRMVNKEIRPTRRMLLEVYA